MEHKTEFVEEFFNEFFTDWQKKFKKEIEKCFTKSKEYNCVLDDMKKTIMKLVKEEMECYHEIEKYTKLDVSHT